MNPLTLNRTTVATNSNNNIITQEFHHNHAKSPSTTITVQVSNKNSKQKSKKKSTKGSRAVVSIPPLDLSSSFSSSESSSVAHANTTTTTTTSLNSSLVTAHKTISENHHRKKKKNHLTEPLATNNLNNHQTTIISTLKTMSDGVVTQTAASPILAVETKKTVNIVMDNYASPIPSSQQQYVRSGSVSSGGMDAEDDANNNAEPQYSSPVSTPRMFSPSSTLNFGAMDSPRELDSPHPQAIPKKSISIQQMPHVEHHVPEHETAADLTSVETHDSEHTTVHSSLKTVALSTSSSVNNSSPALEIGNHEEKNPTRGRSNSTKSSHFTRPLERAHTAPNIITKQQPERQSKSRLSSKYGQSEYKTFVKHSLKLKETGDMRVRGISLKYETNYHEFLEEAISHKSFVTEMNLLNQFLKSNEPGTRYCCLGFSFFCCTLGLSMIPFLYQLSHFENSVRKYLDDLNKKYASAHVSWKLVPSTTPSDESYVVVSLEKEIDPSDLSKLDIP